MPQSIYHKHDAGSRKFETEFRCQRVVKRKTKAARGEIKDVQCLFTAYLLRIYCGRNAVNYNLFSRMLNDRQWQIQVGQSDLGPVHFGYGLWPPLLRAKKLL